MGILRGQSASAIFNFDYPFDGGYPLSKELAFTVANYLSKNTHLEEVLCPRNQTGSQTVRFSLRKNIG